MRHPLPDLDRPTAKLFHDSRRRTCAPSETLARIRPLLPQFGITRLGDITGLDRVGLPVVMACRPNSRSLAVSQGKGISLDAARVSAAMESIEAYHAERLMLPLRYASYHDLRRAHRVADPDDLSQRKVSRYHPRYPLLWVEGWDMLQREDLWVLYEMVHTNYTLPRAPGSGCFVASTNGLASGNHVLEAIAHAVCEVVERDAATLWGIRLLQSARRTEDPSMHEITRVRLDSIDDHECLEVIARLHRAGLDVGVWDITSDVGIPTFMCRIAEAGGGALVHLDAAGYGCHPLRAIALLRALTEAAQSRLTIIAGSRDDVTRPSYERAVADAARRRREQWCVGAALRDWQAIGEHETSTLDEDVHWMLERLSAAGLDRVIVFDLSQEGSPVSVVRVVIPRMDMTMMQPSAHAFGKRALALL